MRKIVLAALILLLPACVGTTRPSRFYSLKSVDEVSSAYRLNAVKSVGIEEVKVPGYLDKPQIVTYKDNSVELNVSELNRWSEPLSVMLQRTVANDMSVYLPKTLVKPKNYGRENFNYTVFIEVNKFDGSFGGDVILDAWWYIFNKENGVLAKERTRLSSPAGDTYDSLVVAQSSLIDGLSRQIAEKVAKLSR